jgi:hypothetical protein
MRQETEHSATWTPLHAGFFVLCELSYFLTQKNKKAKGVQGYSPASITHLLKENLTQCYCPAKD